MAAPFTTCERFFHNTIRCFWACICACFVWYCKSKAAAGSFHDIWTFFSPPNQVFLSVYMCVFLYVIVYYKQRQVPFTTCEHFVHHPIRCFWACICACLCMILYIIGSGSSFHDMRALVFHHPIRCFWACICACLCITLCVRTCVTNSLSLSTHVYFVCVKLCRGCAYTCICTCTCTCICYIYMYMYMYICTYTHIYTAVDVHIHVHVYICICICIYVRTYIYMYTQKHQSKSTNPDCLTEWFQKKRRIWPVSRGGMRCREPLASKYAYMTCPYMCMYICMCNRQCVSMYIYINIYIYICIYIYIYIYISYVYVYMYMHIHAQTRFWSHWWSRLSQEALLSVEKICW